jgi:hypothetical protein
MTRLRKQKELTFKNKFSKHQLSINRKKEDQIFTTLNFKLKNLSKIKINI